MRKKALAITREQRTELLTKALERQKLDHRILYKTDKVLALRQEIEALEGQRRTNKQLATDFGISESYVHQILNGRA